MSKLIRSKLNDKEFFTAEDTLIMTQKYRNVETNPENQNDID